MLMRAVTFLAIRLPFKIANELNAAGYSVY